MRAVNLIPKEERGGASVGAGRSEGAAYAVLGVLAVVAVMALLYGQAHHKLASRKAEAATLTARAQAAQAEASQLAPYTSFVQLKEQRQQAVSTLVDSRFDWAHAFHEFGRVLTPETSITSLDGSVGSTATSTATATATPVGAAGAASTVSSATPAGSVPTFTLQGCGKSQRAVALMLERLRLIDGVDEVTLQSSSKSSSGGSGGSCPAGTPVFTATVVFDALPSTAAAVTVRS
jgi:Tfp pilus assembly protein PilN